MKATAACSATVFLLFTKILAFGFLDARGRVSLKGYAEEAANAKRLFQEVALGVGRGGEGATLLKLAARICHAFK